MARPVYLAFEPADAPAAAPIAAALAEAGWTVRRGGELQGAALSQAVGEAGVIVPLISPASAASEGFQREIAAAFSNGRPMVPALIADIPAESWLRRAYDADRAVDFRGGPTALAQSSLVEAVHAAATSGRVIAMLNIKGGVGKTVLAANLFAAAHLADKRAVSFVDLDPQHNLTQYFLPPAERSRVRAEGGTIYSALRADSGLTPGAFANLAVPLNRAKGKRPRFELIPGDERLFEFTLNTPSEQEREAAFARFRSLIALLRTRSDAVVIDANPCATFLTRLAVTAADHIVAPVRPETYSLTGLNMLEQVVRAVRGRPLRAGEFSVLLNGVNDRARAEGADPDALTRAEISAAPFFGGALLEESVPYSGALRASPTERYAVNPINVTAMMRMGGRNVKEKLAATAAAILRRAAL